MKTKTSLLAIIICLATGIILSNGELAAAASNTYGLLVPSNKVHIYQGETQVGTYSSETILPNNRWLQCEGDCSVRVWGMDFTAKDQTRFAFATSGRDQILQIETGRIHFSLFDPKGTISFNTPHGIFTVQQIIRKAAMSIQPLKGYLTVNGQQTDLGVLEGGTLVVGNDEGEVVVEPGQNLMASNSLMGGNSGAETGAGVAESELNQGVIITGGAIGAAAGGIVIYNNNKDGSDSRREISPSTP